ANAYMSIYSGEGHHDGKVQEYDFTVGSSGDKSGVVMNVAYVNQHEIWAGNRDMSKEPVRGQGTASGSAATANGLFELGDLTGSGGKGLGHALGFKFVPAPLLCPKTTSVGSGYGSCDITLNSAVKGKPALSDFRNFSGGDRYNFAPLNYFVTPNERTSFYAEGHYDLADNLTFTASTLFNKRNSQQSLASSPLF